MGLFDWLKPGKKKSSVIGSLEYIPGSHSFSEDSPMVIEEGKLKKRMFVQPSGESEKLHSNIPIYTGNPFRELSKV